MKYVYLAQWNTKILKGFLKILFLYSTNYSLSAAGPWNIMCVCVCVCLCVCVNIHTHVYICLCVDIYVYMFVYRHKCIYHNHIFTKTYIHLYMHICDGWWWFSRQDMSDCSPPGTSVRGLSQARILEQVAISSSRGSSQPRDQTWVSCSQIL